MKFTKICPPKFAPVTVEDKLQDGYWVQAVDINGNGMLDLVTSGLALGGVCWYENPSWKRHEIATFSKSVATDAADIDGDGRTDLVVCHDYGSCMYNCRPEDGKISWVRNPGSYGSDEQWEVRHIDDLMATHRMRLGRFTQTKDLELLALPIVGTDGVHEPIKVMLYRRPADLLSATQWDGVLVDGSTYRIIHDVVSDRFNARYGSQLESVLLASEEGISWLRYGADGQWRVDLMGSGELGQVEKTHFKGSGNLAIGKLGEDRYAYIATLEPYHGNTVAVYHKESQGFLSEARWKRTLLDVYGDPDQAGEGAGHHMVCGDFDSDGDDEFLVALRGPMPWQGVFYYKAIDVDAGLWTKTRVAEASAARIALGDFDGDGYLDFATTGYYVPGYFLCDDPRVMLYLNRSVGG
jgi:hypothetical protein